MDDAEICSITFWKVLSDSSLLPLPGHHPPQPNLEPLLEPEGPHHLLAISVLLLDCELKGMEPGPGLFTSISPHAARALGLEGFSCMCLLEWINQWVSEWRSEFSSICTQVFLFQTRGPNHHFRKFVTCYDRDSERTLKKFTEEIGKVNVALTHRHIFSYIISIYIWGDFLLKG